MEQRNIFLQEEAVVTGVYATPLSCFMKLTRYLNTIPLQLYNGLLQVDVTILQMMVTNQLKVITPHGVPGALMNN
jgi:hypothetical protein